MKKTLLICTVVFLGLGASAQVKKTAVQSPQPLTVSTVAAMDKTTYLKVEAEKKAMQNLQSEIDRKERLYVPSVKNN